MGNQASKRFQDERKGAQKQRQRQGHMQQNLVHEEFNQKIEEVYDVRGAKLIGKGGFGSVMAIRHRATGKRFAVKTVELKEDLEAKDFKFILTEVELLKKLDHPNIVRVQEVYHAPACLYIVMDLYTGGDLFDRYKFESEQESASIVRKILNAIRYCHDQGVAHRDLKLENIMFETDETGSEIKLVDFGLGSLAGEGVVRHDLVGSWVYMAPEVIRRAHSPKSADMWSLGVISYCLLAGYPPFRSDTLKGLKHAVLAAPVEFNGSVWKNISAEAKDFVARLLQKDEYARMTALEAQDHPWMSRCAATRKKTLDPSVFTNLRRFQHTNLMKKVALSVIARTLDIDDLQKLEAEFAKADVHGSGIITIDDFRAAMARQGGRLSASEVDAIFVGLDLEGTGKVNFTEFMAAALGRHKLDEARLRYAFERLDFDHDGSIDVQDLQMMVGLDMSEEQVREAIRAFDADGDGRVAYSEFFNGMRVSGQSVQIGPTAQSRRLSLRESMMRASMIGASPSPSIQSAPPDSANEANDNVTHLARGPARLFRRAKNGSPTSSPVPPVSEARAAGAAAKPPPPRPEYAPAAEKGSETESESEKPPELRNDLTSNLTINAPVIAQEDFVSSENGAPAANTAVANDSVIGTTGIGVAIEGSSSSSSVADGNLNSADGERALNERFEESNSVRVGGGRRASASNERFETVWPVQASPDRLSGRGSSCSSRKGSAVLGEALLEVVDETFDEAEVGSGGSPSGSGAAEAFSARNPNPDPNVRESAAGPGLLAKVLHSFRRSQLHPEKPAAPSNVEGRQISVYAESGALNSEMSASRPGLQVTAAGGGGATPSSC